jgi:hypothetical protein
MPTRIVCAMKTCNRRDFFFTICSMKMACKKLHSSCSSVRRDSGAESVDLFPSPRPNPLQHVVMVFRILFINYAGYVPIDLSNIGPR